MKMLMMLLVVVFLVMSVSVVHAAVLKLDVNDKDANTAVETEPGFSSIVMGVDNQTATTTVNGVTVTIISDTTQGNDRRRNAPTGIPFEQIYRDFIFGRADGLTVNLAGLEADSAYDITMYSFDMGSTANPPREGVWTANGNYLLTTSFDGTVLPTAAEDYEFSGQAVTDGLGQITLQSSKGPSSPAVEAIYSFINALIIGYPTTANTPDPADGATGVAETGPLTLSWNAGLIDDPQNAGAAIVNPDITTHYLYMTTGTGDPNLRLVAEIPADGPVASYPLSDLGLDKVFQWSVEEGVNGAAPGEPNNVRGAVWTFATQVSVPVINAQPTDVRALPGEVATIAVDASSITPLTYTWFKSDDDVIDASDIPILTGLDQSVLAITLNSDTALAVQNDQAYYYCILDNGIEVETQVVSLMVKREIAHYAFDGNADDSSIQANHGIANDPVQAYSEGIFGGAAVFTGDPNSYIDLGVDGIAFSDPAVGGALEGSVSVWVKTSSTAFLNVCGSFNTSDNSGFQVNINEGVVGRVKAFIRGGQTINVQVNLGAGTVLLDGQWHHLAFTWSASANVGVAYLDGEIVSTQTENASPQLTPWEFPMTIGARNVRGVIGGFLIGELDELVIYNYAMPKTNVYDLYLAGPAESLCDAYPEYDWNENCIVDLADFALFASKWLECGKYPVESCD